MNAPLPMPGPITKLLAGLEKVTGNPQDAGVMGLAQGLLAASAPHMLTPVSMGQALGMGLQGSQAYQHAALQNAIQREAALPFATTRTQAVERAFRDAMNPALPPHQRAAAAYQVDSLMGWNAASDPTVANRLAAIKAQYQPVPQAPGTTLTTAANVAQGAGGVAHGAAPEASTYDPATNTVTPAAGAPAAIAANAANRAGGTAAATYPYQAALHTVTPAAGLTAQRLGPVPGGFQPVVPTTPNGVAPQATIQRMIGVQQGVANAAQAAGRPSPIPQAPASQGASPLSGPPIAGYELQKQSAKQTLDQESGAAKETEAAQAQLARLTEMQQALGRMPLGGNVAKLYDTVGEALNYAGIKFPGLAAMQEYAKYRTNFVADAARKMGANVSYQEVGYITKGVPDFTLAGNAPRALLAQLQGASQYDIARNQAMAYYANHVPNVYGKQYQRTTRGFEQWWQKTGVTPGAFMFLSTADSLPPAQQAQYLASFQRNATGKAYMSQYRKAQAFLRQHPQLVPFWKQQ